MSDIDIIILNCKFIVATYTAVWLTSMELNTYVYVAIRSYVACNIYST